MKFKLSIVLVCLLAFLSFFNHTTYAQSISANKGNLSSGIAVQGKLSSSKAADTYKFTTNKDGEVYISLDQTTAGFYLYLYNEDGETITSDYYSSRGSKIVLKEEVQKGTYYVKVAPYSWSGISSATYRLKATYPGNITRNATTFEPNDTMETSMNINSGQIYKSTSESDIDQDVYQFTTNKDGEVYISLDETTAGYSMYLYDKNGNKLGGDYYSTKGNTIVISDTVEKGTYYIKVNPYSWKGITSATYRLKATYTGSIKRDVSTFEPNETPDTAMDISSNKYYSSTSYSKSDRDVYKFKVSQDGNTVVQLDNTTGGYSMYLYNEDGKSLGGDYYSSRGNTIIIKEKLAKGTYYIKINPYSWSGISSASYRLKATYPSDTTKPDSVKVTVKSKTTNGVTLSLSAHDASGIKQYEIYRNNKLVKTVGNVKEYTDTNLQPNTTYTYKIKAFDPSNNTAESSAINVKTNPKGGLQSGVFVEGKMTSSSAGDTYTFTTNKDGEVYITLDQTTAGYSMYLYNQDGDRIAGDYYSSRGSKIVINEDIQKGTYYVKVEPYSWSGISSATYRIKATYAGEISRNPSTFEPNETNETGISVNSGQMYTSTSESNIDQDVYQFTTTKDGEVYISLDQTTAGYSMYLYNQNGDRIAGDYYSSKGSKIVIDEEIQQGTYYVKIKPYEWSGTTSATYRIKATYAGTIKRDAATFEPNETIETAMNIVSGQTYSSSSYSSVDRDVYQFTTKKDGNAKIVLDNMKGGYSMYLYDQYGQRMAGDYYSSAGNVIEINEDLSQGTYYVKVTPYEWSGISSATYRVKATYPK